MRTLERFWQWHRDEQPTVELARKMAFANVSGGGRVALDIAASLIDCRVNGGALGCRVYTGEALAHYPEALRELSLVLCRGLARMVEQVPAREPVTFRREYLGEWHTPDTADAMAYALQASTAHTEFYAGCLTCQQARYRDQREQKRDRMAAMYETMPMPEAVALPAPSQRTHCIRNANDVGDGRRQSRRQALVASLTHCRATGSLAAQPRGKGDPNGANDVEREQGTAHTGKRAAR